MKQIQIEPFYGNSHALHLELQPPPSAPPKTMIFQSSTIQCLKKRFQCLAILNVLSCNSCKKIAKITKILVSMLYHP